MEEALPGHITWETFPDGTNRILHAEVKNHFGRTWTQAYRIENPENLTWEQLSDLVWRIQRKFYSVYSHERLIKPPSDRSRP